MARIYYLVGPPAAGKRTVGLELARLTGAALVDNHLVNDPVFTAIGADGVSPLPRVAFELAARVRVIVLEAVRLAPGTTSHVFTNYLTDTPGDAAFVATLRGLAAQRSAGFVPVWLRCDTERLVERVALPDRLSRNKLRDPAQLLHLLEATRPLLPPPDALVVDTTRMPPAGTARAILAWAEQSGI